jgi:hypothetical protein
MHRIREKFSAYGVVSVCNFKVQMTVVIVIVVIVEPVAVSFEHGNETSSSIRGGIY